MTNRAPVIEWYQCDDDAAWQAVITTPFVRTPAQAAQASAHRAWRRWHVILAGILLLVVVCAGGWRLRQADQRMTAMENDVRAAVEANIETTAGASQAAQPTGNTAAAQRVTASTPPHPSGIQAGRVEVRGDYALVDILVPASDLPWLPAPYRQTIFYQATAQGWQPTDPVETFWQPTDTVQVGRFTFVYGRRDAAAVLTAAQHLEALDAELHAELGLPPATAPLTIKVVAELPATDPTVLSQLVEGAVLAVPSPALLPLPADISAGDALQQLLAGVLAQHTLDEALVDSPRACQWRSLATGVQRWLLWQHSDLPSQDGVNGARFLRDRLAREIRLGPNRDACRSDPYARELRTNYLVDSMATAFVEYSVAAYGRERLPVLLAGLRRYDTWEALIQGVYGVSPAEFAAGWQAHMRRTEG